MKPRSLYEQLREEIIAGELVPGAPLPETSLARQYQVSRTPVREALLQLQSDGLVVRIGKGISVSVAAPSPEEVLSIYEVRISLEGAAARFAAERRTDLDLRRLAMSHRVMSEQSTSGRANSAEPDVEFHRNCWAAGHNATLTEMLQRVRDRLPRHRGMSLVSSARWQTILQEHAELLAAISDRDPGAAEEIARRHVTAARTARLEQFASAVVPRERTTAQ